VSPATTATVEAAARVLGDRAHRDVELGSLTTYRVGGPAALLVRVETDDDLRGVAGAVRESTIEVLVVGNGSNLLVSDDGFEGLAIVLGERFAQVEIDGTRCRAGGAARLPVVARRTAAAGLTGFEWAVGVPGSVGGAVRMNAGGHGSDMAASLTRIRRLDLRTGDDREVDVADLGLAFRTSQVEPHHLVVWADIRLAEGDRAVSERMIEEIVRWRRDNQPGGANAGSVFVNPVDDSAGRLIELSGCKGLRHRSAEVSTKHANFIQADEGGSARDIHALMVEVHDRVLEATGVDLRPETRLVGFPDSPLRTGP
jgi:UDP-N-acetylmuramate dehydrogenase